MMARYETLSDADCPNCGHPLDSIGDAGQVKVPQLPMLLRLLLLDGTCCVGTMP